MSILPNKMIHYSWFPTESFGILGVGVSNQGLCLLSFGYSNEEDFLIRLRRRFLEQNLVFDSGKTQPAQKQLQEYLNGKRKAFDLSLNHDSLGTPFQRKVLEATANIPYCQVVSYGDLAHRIGAPKSSRAVGNALGKNPIPIVIPCHRVVASDGSLGGYTGGLEYKKRLLRLEGVKLPTANKQLL